MAKSERKQSRLVNAETSGVIVACLEVADTSWRRAVGLIGRSWLAPDAGLWLHPCNGIHTFGVRFPIDALFLDAQGRALRIVSDVAPCRICGPVRHACTVVELPAGTLAKLGLEVGARLEIVQVL